MTYRAAFKAGFAERMAQLGITPSVLSYALEKRAEDGPLDKALSGAATHAGRALFLGPAFLASLVGFSMGGRNRVSSSDLRAVRDLGMLEELAWQKRRLEQQRRERQQLEVGARV